MTVTKVAHYFTLMFIFILFLPILLPIWALQAAFQKEA